MDDFSQFLSGSAKSAPSPTNVGNIRPVGSSTGFQQYATAEEGIKAIDENLKAYGSKHKIDTLRGVISRWAPPSENDTESYIKFVSQKTGLKPDEKIDLTNPTIRHIISGPIVLQEQGLERLKGKSQPSPAPDQTAPQPMAEPMDDFSSFLGGATEKPEPTVKAEAPKPAPIAPQKPKTLGEQTKEFGKGFASLADVALGIVPAGLNLGTYATARALQKSPEEAEKIASRVSAPSENVIGRTLGITEDPAYQKEASRKLMDFIGKNINKGAEWIAKNTGLPVQDVQNITNSLSFAVAPEIGKGVTKVVGKGAEAITEQFAKRKATEAGGEMPQGFKSQVSEDVLRDVRLKKSSDLPVPVELTEGQASQNPVLISRERNERGFKEAHAQRFNEQNKALQENANIIKQNVAPNVLTTDYVADATNLIDSVKAIKEANKTKTQEAYKALEDAAGGKFPIDGKKFANNAIEKLTAEDRLDYLPSTIKNKLDSYAAGSKEMNFNLFENLRSDLAAEMRKADRAGDGNMKNVLSVVRNELENLPMQEGDVVLKGLADNARKTAKADFDLEKSNPLYSKVLNEAADSKDFIQNFVIRSKNADFMKSVDLLKSDPIALEHLRSGTMDYIIRESTDASGNFSNAKFTKAIENLNVNKKLDALFGENSKQLQDLAEVAKIVEARPKGSFVNESNTATAIGSMAKQYGGELIRRIPVVGAIVEPAAQVLQQRKINKEVKKSLNPKPKTKLTDIGK
jgi:hypothetical protein